MPSPENFGFFLYIKMACFVIHSEVILSLRLHKTILVQSKFAGEYTSVTYSPMDDDDDDEVTEEIQRRSDLDEACVVGLACHQRTG